MPGLKIISPVDRVQEAALLLEAGADELYAGFVPSQWRRSYGLLASINQRTFARAQLQTMEELKAILSLTKVQGRRFAVTLNTPFYVEEQLPKILHLVDELRDLGVDGIILADLGLLRLIRDRHPGLELQASTLARLTNSAALDFYRRQGIHRAVLPRHLTLEEMTAIARQQPELRLDAFLLVGKCPNTEGLCTFHHASSERIWPCEIPYRIHPAAEPASTKLQAAMARQASWSRSDRRHGCGLCAIPALLGSGLYGMKLVGRGAPTAHKVGNVRLAREFLHLAVEEGSTASFRQRARAAHRERFGAPCSANVCYYPEFYQE